MDRIDKYEIVETVGGGGMGTVYKALHPQFKKYIAIKEVNADLANNPEMLERFEREVELLAKLPPHPNIVTVRDALNWRGKLYIVMDYIDGEPLSSLLRRGPVEPGKAARILDQVLAGLEAIHELNIVHRDVKAGNILLDRSGVAHIGDFGIAEYVGEKSFAVMASAKCAAPEVIAPELGRGGNPRQADIYALGMLAYEMLLGESLFRSAFSDIFARGEAAATKRWIDWHTDLKGTAQDLTGLDQRIPERLAGVVQKMMAKDVRRRYADARTIRKDIEACMKDLPKKRDAFVPDDDRTVRIDRRPAEFGGTARGNRRAFGFRLPERMRESRLWWTGIGGGIAVVALLVLLFFVLPVFPGFTVVVKGAPLGSVAYIDDAKCGIPLQDGTIRIPGLLPGTKRLVIACQGYADFDRKSVFGKDGETVVVEVRMNPASAVDEITWRDTARMVRVPEGEFVMGSNDSFANERPEHKVQVAEFFIDKFEVTNAQYRAFCEATNRVPPLNPIWAKKHLGTDDYFNEFPDHPVVGVQYEDAAAYANWAGKRLPTEAEWEKAASWGPTGEKRRWPWGNGEELNRAHFGENATAKVGAHPDGASAYGVQDLAGNVAEWVGDFYKPYPGGAADPDFGKSLRVVRGGTFAANSDPRTTVRYPNPPVIPVKKMVSEGKITVETPIMGFRCAVSGNDPNVKIAIQSER